MSKYSNIAIILAAGKGDRFDKKIPKQYHDIEAFNGKTMLEKICDIFATHKNIDGLLVVIGKNDENYLSDFNPDIYDGKFLGFVTGGLTRQDSARLGLEEVEKYNPQNILIHDGCRPFVSNKLIDRLLQTLDKYEAVIPTIKVVETLREIQNDKITIRNREDFILAQTPQAFRFKEILRLHREFKGKNFTDDVALSEAGGIEPKIIEGERSNIKVTMKEDLMFFGLSGKDRMNNFEIRTGIGFDIHKLIKFPDDTVKAERNIKICGIEMKSDYYLEGHSDADVGLHAVMDALLGAAGKGDIGEHFPPDDDKWKNADSGDLLNQLVGMLHEDDMEIINIDMVVICEKPKLGDFKKLMAKRIADLSGIKSDRVNVKATTSETLGFIGRGEGIASQATVSLKYNIRGDS